MADDPEPIPISEDELGELFRFRQDPTQIVEGDGVVTAWSFAWFPKDEWTRATELWPDLLDQMPADHDAYSKVIESRLKAATAAGAAGSPDVSPLHVDELIAEYGDEAGDGRSRAKLSAQVARHGRAISWPPERNDRCWCGSGLKYKVCCGPIPAE